MSEHQLRLEVWEDFGEGEASLPALLYAGPLGDEPRCRLGPKARLLTTIWAGSHFEAMTIYYRLMGWGEYSSDQPWDFQPYPQEWLLEQQKAEQRAAADWPRECWFLQAQRLSPREPAAE
jgi:hypothetical protein